MLKKDQPTVYYHFTGDRLRNGDPIPKKRTWLVFDGAPVPCQCGLHASPDPFDALKYAPGSKLHQVHLGGTIVPHGKPVDKFAGQKRKIIASIDATDIMRLFARRVALDVIHLWNAPPIVREFLETGDESKRAAAWAAAWAAARDAAWAAAWAAARDAAQAAARDAAWDAVQAAAWAAAQLKYRGWFNEMCISAFEMKKVKK
jgi:hypothetical protein